MICRQCPRACGALRTPEQGLGACRMPQVPVVARAALHMWEEPPISGSRGSGTIFFSGCSLGCVFCQNRKISQEDFGKAVTLEHLGEICDRLITQGAHNINFVNPTHYAMWSPPCCSPIPCRCLWYGTPEATTRWIPCAPWRGRWTSTCPT